MFDYPLSIPQHTLYQELGVSPESTAEEIREAEQEATARLTQKKEKVDLRLTAVHQKIPDLKKARQELKELQSRDDPDSGQLRKVLKSISELEQRAIREEPEFKQLEKATVEFEEQIHRINSLQLSNPEKRAVYDRANPPLGLLKLSDCTRDSFTANAIAVHLLRRELSQFLTERGERVFHPSDLTRDDFSADFSPNPILDGGPL